jgi:hypothetical protein
MEGEIESKKFCSLSHSQHVLHAEFIESVIGEVCDTRRFIGAVEVREYNGTRSD